jgi:hypothetical protein
MLVVGMPAVVEAGFIQVWQLKETAAAPVLVVGRVLGVQKGDRAPAGSLPWKAETLAMTAEIQVLRAYTGSGEPIEAGRLRVGFFAYGPSVTQFINGYPPPLPNIEPGRVLILPLQENRSPASESWKLMADSGVDLAIPTRAEIADSVPAPPTARAFLIREIANALNHGTPAEVFAAVTYLSSQLENLSGDFLPLLKPAGSDQRQRWAELATDALASYGTPRPSVADLMSAKGGPKDWPGHPNLFLVRAALHELKASPETDDLLIKTWIAEAPLHAWGSAGCLLEYADNPVTTDTLRQALRNDLAGSSYIAWTFAHAGHPTALPEALARALRVADRPDSDYADLQGAAALLRDFGSDRELGQLAALVRKYQTADPKFYGVLWQYATEDGNPREARVLAVVLHDRRIAVGDTRYCDFALAVLEKAVGRQFGAGGKTLKERDDAVSRALVWLKSQGLSHLSLPSKLRQQSAGSARMDSRGSSPRPSSVGG